MKKVLVAAALAMCACGEPLGEFCSALKTTNCERQKACNIAASDASCADIESSARLVTPPCSATLAEAVKEGRVRYDELEARRCLNAMSTQCVLGDACEKVFAGTAALGAACTEARECAGETWCDRTSTCPGICTARAGDGAIVTDSRACNTDRRDFLSDGTVRCIAGRENGSACEQDVECRLGSTCVEGQCATEPRAGEPCDETRCASGFYCKEGSCKAFAKRGEACGNELVAVDLCQRGLSCRDGVCGDVLRDGAPCGNAPNNCAAGLKCSGQPEWVCTPRGSEGAACVSLFDCVETLGCNDGKCAPRRASGPCTDASSCLLGYACISGQCAIPQCAP